MSTTNKKTVCEESIRVAAYYNWQNAGCPSGKDEYFWNQAIKQLYGTCNKTSSSCGCNNTTKKTTATKTSSKTTAKASTAKTSAAKASVAKTNTKSSSKK